MVILFVICAIVYLFNPGLYYSFSVVITAIGAVIAFVKDYLVHNSSSKKGVNSQYFVLALFLVALSYVGNTFYERGFYFENLYENISEIVCPSPPQHYVLTITRSKIIDLPENEWPKPGDKTRIFFSLGCNSLITGTIEPVSEYPLQKADINTLHLCSDLRVGKTTLILNMRNTTPIKTIETVSVNLDFFGSTPIFDKSQSTSDITLTQSRYGGNGSFTINFTPNFVYESGAHFAFPSSELFNITRLQCNPISRCEILSIYTTAFINASLCPSCLSLLQNTITSSEFLDLTQKPYLTNILLTRVDIGDGKYGYMELDPRTFGVCEDSNS